MRAALSVVLMLLATQAQGQTVTTDAASYTRGDTVTATFADLAPLATATTYLALARTTDSDDHHSVWSMVGAVDGGEVELGPAGQGCSLEVRVYRNFSYEILARSAAFEVDCGVDDTVVGTDAASYFPGDPMTFSWTNGTMWDRDWLAVIPAGATPLDYVGWSYLSPDYAASWSGEMLWSEMIHSGGVSDLPPGEYELLYLLNDTYDVVASASFEVRVDPASPVGLTADAVVYTPSTPVEGCWSGTDGDPTNWLGIAKQGHPATELYSYTDATGAPLWAYLSGTDGCQTLPACADTGSCGPMEGVKALGPYALRLFGMDSYIALSDQVPFLVDFEPGGAPVAGASASTDSGAYVVGEAIEVSFAGFEGNATDLVAIHHAAAPADERNGIVAWSYTGGALSGTHTFTEYLGAGSYIARGFAHDSYTPSGTSAPFTVTADPAFEARVFSDPTCLPTGASDLHVYFDNVAYPADVWVGLWPAAAPADSFSLAWDWVPEGTPSGDGTFLFSPLSAGAYEIRLVSRTRKVGYRSPVHVADACPLATVSTNQPYYIVGDTIEVDWEGMEPHPHYRAGLFGEGDDPATDAPLHSIDTASALRGGASFPATTPGLWVAHGYHAYTGAVAGSSAAVPVCPEGMLPDCTLTCLVEVTEPFSCE
jgi:hypothetical protein